MEKRVLESFRVNSGNTYKVVLIDCPCETEIKNEYIRIIRENVEDRKTPIYHIVNNSSNFEIAKIKWYGAWRQYCIFFSEDTVFNIKCLELIENFLKEINRKEK